MQNIFGIVRTSVILPYVLNALNLMRLLRISTGRVQIDNNNINSTLQHILQNCNFIEDIILLVSA